MNAQKIDKILTQYARLMEELKQRSILLGLLIDNQLNLSDVPRFELCQLQIRSICEILALACITAHNDLHEVQSASIQTEYNAEKIFKRLERLRPDFYPVPHDRELVETNLLSPQRHFHLIPQTEGFLKKEELIKSYNDCGSYLHRGSIRRLITKWYPDIDFQKIRDRNEKLGRLFAPYHYIKIADGKKYILCVMNDINNNNTVQCSLAESNTDLPQGISL